MPQRKTLSEYKTFVQRAARRPSTVGAVLPTSNHVAEAIAEVLPASGTPTVLELGPGTGALSDAIHRRLPEGANHLAVEIDPEMVRYLRTTKPWLRIIEGDATDLGRLLSSVGTTRVDAVVSSIPWTLLSPEKQRELLDETARALTANGVFTAITYLTALWRKNTTAFIGELHQAFDEVLPRATVWRNVPPGRIYVCRQPKGGTSRRAL